MLFEADNLKQPFLQCLLHKYASHGNEIGQKLKENPLALLLQVCLKTRKSPIPPSLQLHPHRLRSKSQKGGIQNILTLG